MLFIFLLLSFVATPAQELESAVQDYWNALLAQDKAAALKFVHPDDLNAFISRREARFESWKLIQTEFESESRAIVRIQLRRILPNGVVGPVKGSETWVKTEAGWRIRVTPSGEEYRRLFAASQTTDPNPKTEQLPARLEIYPETVHFYALFPRQPRLLHVRNGLGTPVENLELQIDPGRFEILNCPDQIEAGSVGTIKLRYLGTEEGENLKTQALLRFQQNGETGEFTIPIVYNYMDEISRWMMKKQNRKPQ
jgi:hypothetical protein